MKVLVLAGTGEARELATRLHDAGVETVTSFAGRVPDPRRPPGETRIGGFGGADGLERYLHDAHITHVVDATHPFAARMGTNAAAACAAARIPLLRLERPRYALQPGDRWIRVPDAHTAARQVAAHGRRVFLSLGGQELVPFAAVTGVHFVIRAVTPPDPPLPPDHHVILARGPFALDAERALLADHAIDVVVARDSGGPDEKLVAARERGLPVLLVERPARPATPTVATVGEALARLR